MLTVWYIVKCMYNLQNFVILSEVLSFYCSKHSICLISNNSSSSWWFIGKEWRRCRFDPWVKKISWRRKWKPTPIFLPGKFHGQRSLVGYSPRDCKRVGHNLTTKQPNNSIYSHYNIHSPWCTLLVSYLDTNLRLTYSETHHISII